MQKILVTGSNGRFGKILQNLNSKKFIFRNKQQCNILSSKSIFNNLKKYRPSHILHLAGLSRPMILHEKDIIKSIDLNIVGTCNLVKEASKLGIKIIYLSTSYVYPGKKGNYKEEDAVKPWNNYSWSKLGGECAVQMYKNSLIIRMCMTEKPFIHKKAYVNVKTNFMYQEDAARIILKLGKTTIRTIKNKSIAPKTLFRAAAILLPLITLSYFSVSQQEKINTVYEQMATLNPFPSAKSISKTPDLKTKRTIEIKSDPINESNAIFSQKTYYIIAGAFAVEENANRMLNKLNSWNYNAMIIKENKLLRVSYNSFQNREDAVLALNKIKKQNPDAWLFTK